MGTVQRLLVHLCTSMLLLSVLPSAQAGCLHYEPTKVLIRGKLVRQTHPGPPNFESIANGDKAETGYYLQPGKPLCTQARPDDEASDHRNQRLIQLVLNDAQYSQLQPLLGQTVRLRGTLFESFTGHHHTAVLMTVLSVEP